jgi:hypothetical protein
MLRRTGLICIYEIAENAMGRRFSTFMVGEMKNKQRISEHQFKLLFEDP